MPILIINASTIIKYIITVAERICVSTSSAWILVSGLAFIITISPHMLIMKKNIIPYNGLISITTKETIVAGISTMLLVATAPRAMANEIWFPERILAPRTIPASIRLNNTEKKSVPKITAAYGGVIPSSPKYE